MKIKIKIKTKTKIKIKNKNNFENGLPMENFLLILQRQKKL